MLVHLLKLQFSDWKPFQVYEVNYRLFKVYSFIIFLIKGVYHLADIELCFFSVALML